MAYRFLEAPLGPVAVALAVAGLSACGTQRDPVTMIAAAYPQDSFVSCREVRDLRSSGVSVMRCIAKNPSKKLLLDLSLDADLVRRHNAAICFWIKDDLVGVHGYGYPDDPTWTKKVPCQPIHE